MFWSLIYQITSITHTIVYDTALDVDIPVDGIGVYCLIYAQKPPQMRWNNKMHLFQFTGCLDFLDFLQNIYIIDNNRYVIFFPNTIVSDFAPSSSRTSDRRKQRWVSSTTWSGSTKWTVSSLAWPSSTRPWSTYFLFPWVKFSDQSSATGSTSLGPILYTFFPHTWLHHQFLLVFRQINRAWTMGNWYLHGFIPIAITD